ncbi:hypothetical protein AAG906_007659 [Vitis piasezkii]
MAYSPQTPPTYSSILQQQSATVPVTMTKVKAATQLIAMKLDDNYYLLWKQQIFAAAEGISFNQKKTLIYSLASVGDIISKHDQILAVTTGLDKEYESEFVQITSPLDLYKSSDVSALLLAHEKRIEQHNTTTTEYVMSTSLVYQGQTKEIQSQLRESISKQSRK